ncbi:reverse transcriptase-like protein [Sporolactobacillus vineae]|uniref:reverse transcriptase-like protein n=1 Tax=Sporolactobacillus vineae TaxID=444463 RepID=UPI000289B8B1|nr:reverse transcriptase-like protein [Sporolactobacillus vineae]
MIDVFFDGASGGNPGLAGAGIYLNLGNGRQLRRSFPLGRLSSNHEAEFAALVLALRFCLDQGYAELSFRTDSQLVNEALQKRYVKKAVYSQYLTQALSLIDKTDLFFCKWIPDTFNKNADQLARLAIRKQQEEVQGKEEQPE